MVCWIPFGVTADAITLLPPPLTAKIYRSEICCLTSLLVFVYVSRSHRSVLILSFFLFFLPLSLFSKSSESGAKKAFQSGTRSEGCKTLALGHVCRPLLTGEGVVGGDGSCGGRLGPMEVCLKAISVKHPKMLHRVLISSVQDSIHQQLLLSFVVFGMSHPHFAFKIPTCAIPIVPMSV